MRQRILWFVVVLGGLAGTMQGLAASPAETELLDQWIRELESGDAPQRREAAYRLHQLGRAAQPAVPVLIKALDDSEQQVWFHAVMTLAEIGPAAREAIPALIEDLQRGSRPRRRGYSAQVWYRTAFALGKIGVPALPALIEALAHQDSGVRAGAAKALTWIGPEGKAAVPGLCRNLNDDDDAVREMSAEALAALGAEARPALVEALTSPPARVRHSAAQALARMGPAAAEAGPALLRALQQESDATVRAELIRALSQIQLAPDQLVPVLTAALPKAQDPERHEIVNALLLIEPAADTTVPPLKEMLASDDPEAQARAAYVLGRIGRPAQDAVPALIAAALATGPVAPESPWVSALIELGVVAVPALITTWQAQAASSPDKGEWIIACLKKIGELAWPPMDHDSVSLLIGALREGEPSVRLYACERLGQLGPKAREAVAELRKLEEDPCEFIRAQARDAIGKIQPDR